MGNKQNRALEVLEGLFQPRDCADVQVVGRFVEQQQVRFGNQCLGQQDAATPAAGQFGESFVGRQLQTAQGAVYQLLQAPAITGFEVLLNVHQLVQVSIGDDVLAQVMVLGQQFANTVQAFGHNVEYGPLVGYRQLLRQFANLEAGRAPNRAVIGFLITFLLGFLGLFIEMFRPEQPEYLQGIIVIAFLLVSVLYYLLSWTRSGSTIGQMVVGARVVGTDGAKLSMGKAILRYLGYLVSAAVFALGFVWVIFDQKRQGWHDKIAGTTIVRVPRGTALL